MGFFLKSIYPLESCLGGAALFARPANLTTVVNLIAYVTDGVAKFRGRRLFDQPFVSVHQLVRIRIIDRITFSALLMASVVAVQSR